jgi:hypothetical protein
MNAMEVLPCDLILIHDRSDRHTHSVDNNVLSDLNMFDFSNWALKNDGSNLLLHTELADINYKGIEDKSITP